MTDHSTDPRLSELVAGFEPRRVHQRRRTGVWVGSIVVLLAVLAGAALVLTRPALDWPTVGRYLFSEPILTGLWVTVYLTVIAQVVGIVVGLVLALMLRSSNPIVRGLSATYVWFMRAVPTLVQLLFWFNLASLFPTVRIGIPGLPSIWEGSPNAVMTPLFAACLALGLQEGAYMAEIIRGGLKSVDRGQHEAAAALGFSGGQTMARIVIPQAMRSIIPPTGNDLISMLKYTSLASVVSLGELLSTAQQIYNNNFRIIPLLVVATIWYLVLVSVCTVGQRKVEQHFGKGFSGSAGARRGRRPLVPAGPTGTTTVEPPTPADRTELSTPAKGADR